MLKVFDVMTRKLIYLKPHQSVSNAYKLMNDYSFRHLPVIGKEDHLIGIVSESDILKSCYRENGRVVIPDIQVAEIMSRNLKTCSPSTLLCEVAATMAEAKINCIPVLSGHNLVGIVTTTDILDLYCRYEEYNGHSFMPYKFIKSRHRHPNYELP